MHCVDGRGSVATQPSRIDEGMCLRRNQSRRNCAEAIEGSTCKEKASEAPQSRHAVLQVNRLSVTPLLDIME